MKYDKLGEILVAYDFISDEQLQLALAAQQKKYFLLGEELVIKGTINDDQLKIALAIQAKLRNTDKRVRAIALIDLAIARFSRKNMVAKRTELTKKADKITDEYPHIYLKKEKK